MFNFSCRILLPWLVAAHLVRFLLVSVIVTDARLSKYRKMMIFFMTRTLPRIIERVNCWLLTLLPIKWTLLFFYFCLFFYLVLLCCCFVAGYSFSCTGVRRWAQLSRCKDHTGSPSCAACVKHKLGVPRESKNKEQRKGERMRGSTMEDLMTVRSLGLSAEEQWPIGAACGSHVLPVESEQKVPGSAGWDVHGSVQEVSTTIPSMFPATLLLVVHDFESATKSACINFWVYYNWSCKELWGMAI